MKSTKVRNVITNTWLPRIIIVFSVEIRIPFDTHWLERKLNFWNGNFLHFTANNFAVGTVWFLSKGVKFCDDVKKFNMKKSKEILLHNMKTSKINCYVTVCILSLTPKMLRMKYYFWLEEIFCFLEMMVIFFSNIIAQFVLVW